MISYIENVVPAGNIDWLGYQDSNCAHVKKKNDSNCAAVD